MVDDPARPNNWEIRSQHFAGTSTGIFSMANSFNNNDGDNRQATAYDGFAGTAFF